jgi:hypothetical protein
MAQRFYKPIARIFTNAGAVAVGYKYYFYATGTTTPVTTYQDEGASVANTNPVLSDANGRFPEIWYSDLSQLKLIVKDSSDNIVNGEGADPVGTSASAASLNDFDVRPTSYWGLTAGTSTAFTLAANPTISSYANNQTFVVQPHLDCGDSPTLAIDGLSALNWKKYTQQGTKVALKANDLRASQRYFCINDGVDIICLNPSSLPILSGSATALTIATGVVTLTNNSSSYVLDTEGAAATDDLNTISGGQDGQIIILNSANAARNVVAKHNAGNIYNPNGFDITLDLTTDFVVLRYNATLTNWVVVSVSAFGSSPSVLISSQTASNAASIAFTNLSSQFSTYEFELINVLPANNGAALVMQFSTDNGSNWINSNYLTDGQVLISDAGNVEAQSSSTRINLNVHEADTSCCASNTANRGGNSGIVRAYNLSSSSIYKTGDLRITASRSTSALPQSVQPIAMWVYYGSTTAINAVRFIFKTFNSDVNNGNIVSGIIKMRGYI